MDSSFFKTDDYIYKPKGGFSGDFGSGSFKYGQGFDANKWGALASTVGKLFDKTRSRDGYDPYDYAGGFRGGQIGGGGVQEALPGLAAVYSQQPGAVFAPGTPAGKGGGGFGDIASGILQGVGAGSALGVPGMIGGAIIGGLGGAFG